MRVDFTIERPTHAEVLPDPPYTLELTDRVTAEGGPLRARESRAKNRRDATVEDFMVVKSCGYSRNICAIEAFLSRKHQAERRAPSQLGPVPQSFAKDSRADLAFAGYGGTANGAF